MAYVSIKKVALRCPIDDSMMYIGSCNATNDRYGCENGKCKWLRTTINERKDVDKAGMAITFHSRKKKHGRKNLRFSNDSQ